MYGEPRDLPGLTHSSPTLRSSDLPPCATIALPVPLASAVVLWLQCTPVGEQALPFRSELAAPEFRCTMPFFLVISWTASATEEVGTSTIASTCSVSIQRLTMLEPMSGLFWWSANRSEEHTSELQSLMRISYAVFCLKKKTKNEKQIN